MRAYSSHPKAPSGYSCWVGLYYLYAGGLFPMIVAHALYDSVQIVQAVIAISRAGR
jgi:hypothetical protein